MRDKRFRLRQKAKYKRKAKEIVKGFISREEFKNSANNKWQGKTEKQYGSYNDLIEDWANHYESNRKRCSCQMCCNIRRSKLEKPMEHLTIQERKALEKARFELEDIKESA